MSTVSPQPHPLPRLPIPVLKDTCDRYLRIVEPLLTPDEFQQTQKVVKEFLEDDGPFIHEAVLMYDKSWESRDGSYVEVWWDDMYLNQRESIMINSSPFFSIQDDPVAERNEQASRAARFVVSLYKYAEQVWSGTLKPDMDAGRGTPLCMHQHQNLLSTTRIPGLRRDLLVNYPRSKHIAVLYRDHIWSFPIVGAGGEPVSVADITQNLREILESGKQLPPVTHPVAVMTTENRTKWAVVRSAMLTSPVNTRSLDLIETAFVVVSLEDARPDSMNDESPYFLHADGRNRWMDKSVQLMVCANGRVGMPMEHSGYDGSTFLRMANEVFAETCTDQAQSAVAVFAPRVPPELLQFELSPAVQRAIEAALVNVAALIRPLHSCALNFTEYGKKFVVGQQLSPDGLVQMAFQLAYYRHTGHFACTYESVMTKSYQHGRTEAGRTVSLQSCSMAKLFCDSAATAQDKRAALGAAVKEHGRHLGECRVGLGVDRHLLALRQTGALLGRNPAIFRDKAYTQVLQRSVLSTSNCTSNSIRLFGFGPVVNEGYGIAYTIRDGSIGLNVSSRTELQPAVFMEAIAQALRDFRAVLEAGAGPAA